MRGNILISIICAVAITTGGVIFGYGKLTQRVSAVEIKANKIDTLVSDVAVIKEKVLRIDKWFDRRFNMSMK